MPEPRSSVGPNGANCKLSTVGYGVRRVKVTELRFGTNIISTGEGEQSRSRKVFYPVVTTGSSFGMTVVFASWGERERFNAWMTRYMEGVSTGTGTSGYMRIEVPGRRFTRIALPEGPLQFGEGVTDVAYQLDLSFVGASDPVNVKIGVKMAGLSYLIKPKRGQSRFFYPSGTQISGAESLEGTLFDQSPDGLGPDDYDDDPIIAPDKFSGQFGDQGV